MNGIPGDWGAAMVVVGALVMAMIVVMLLGLVARGKR